MFIENQVGLRLDLVLRETPLDTLTSHDLLPRHRCRHSIGIHLRVVRLDHLRHECTMKALLLRYGTVLVGKEESLEVDNLLS